ncbi:11479_t:CDS:2, partial [Gigaspora rosea]
MTKRTHKKKNINDEPNLELQNLIETRWLSLSNVAENLYQIIDLILLTLNEDLLSDYVALLHLKPHLKTAINLISKSFIRSTDIQPTY